MPVEIKDGVTVLAQEEGSFGPCPRCGKEIRLKCSGGAPLCFLYTLGLAVVSATIGVQTFRRERSLYLSELQGLTLNYEAKVILDMMPSVYGQNALKRALI